MQPYFKDNLKKIKNGRRPKKMKMEDDLNFFWKSRMTTSKKNEDNHQKIKMEDGLKKNGRRPTRKMEDEPINPNQPN